MSLKSLEKRIHGIKGKERTGSGISEYQNWDAFIKAFSLVWSNAKLYNEDGSEISQAAGELDVSWLRHST